MAKKTKTPVNRKRRQRKEMSGFGPLLFIGLATVALFSPPVAILISAGLVPAIVLGFTGKGENKALRLQCVTFANLGGVIPFTMQIWSRPQSLETVLSDPINLVIMWGSAAIGYALIYVGPIVATYILQGMSQDRIKQIVQQKQSLVEMWGHEVLGDKEEAPAPKHIIPRKS